MEIADSQGKFQLIQETRNNVLSLQWLIIISYLTATAEIPLLRSRKEELDALLKSKQQVS